MTTFPAGATAGLRSMHDLHPAVARLRVFTTLLCLAATATTIGMSLIRPDETLNVVVPALGIFLVISIPIFVTRSIDAFSPWAYLTYWTFIDVFLRALYVALDVPNATTIDIIFLLGHDKEFLLFPGIVVLIGCVFVSAGYLAGGRQADEPGEFDLRKDQWDARRFKIVVAGLLILAWIGLVQFVIVTLGDLSALIAASLSAYRGISDDLNEYSAHGWLRAMVGLSDLAFYLTLTAIMTSRRPAFWIRGACFLAFLTSVAFYTFTQSRAAVLVLVVYALVLRYYFGHRKLPVKILPIVVPALFAIFLVLTALRKGSGYTTQSIQELSPVQLVEPLVVNNGGIDVSKTGQIIAHYGPKLDLSVGRTYLWLFVAWVPRAWWPEKPVNIDTEIGMSIYGAGTYGTGAVPPGLIGEVFLNFWYLGIPIACWILGRGMRAVNSRFIVAGAGRNAVLIYVIFFMATGPGVLGSSLVSFAAGVLVQIIPLALALRFITVTTPSDQSTLSTT